MKNSQNKFSVKLKDFLLANLVLIMGVTLANAQAVTVKHVPLDQFFKSQNIGTMNISVANNQIFVNTPQSTTSVNVATTTKVITITNINNNLCNTFVNNLTYGNRGQEVIKLQQLLNTKESANLPVTGYFGPMTNKALIKFQYKYGLQLSGVTDASTRIYLNSSSCGNALKVINAIPYKFPVSNNKSILYKNPKYKVSQINKAGFVTSNVIGTPKNVKFGTNKNVNSNTDLEKIIQQLRNSTTSSTSTISTNTVKKVENKNSNTKTYSFFKNFWSNYKANFKKVENK